MAPAAIITVLMTSGNGGDVLAHLAVHQGSHMWFLSTQYVVRMNEGLNL